MPNRCMNGSETTHTNTVAFDNLMLQEFQIMFEEYLITHCSPTLVSLKPASLFLYRFSSGEELYESVAVWDAQFQKKGIRITILREDTETALIYVYRPDTMVRELSRPEIISFLVSTGYQAGTIDQMLEQLRSRLHGSEEFPHEIGVFLGYPLNDVLGFIKNHGSNCKGMGDWKVYGDLGEAQKTFAKFKKCREIYANLWHQGRTIWQLTVAA